MVFLHAQARQLRGKGEWVLGLVYFRSGISRFLDRLFKFSVLLNRADVAQRMPGRQRNFKNRHRMGATFDFFLSNYPESTIIEYHVVQQKKDHSRTGKKFVSERTSERFGEPPFPTRRSPQKLPASWSLPLFPSLKSPETLIVYFQTPEYAERGPGSR